MWGTAFAEVLLELPVRFLPPNYRPAADEVVRGTWSEEVSIGVAQCIYPARPRCGVRKLSDIQLMLAVGYGFGVTG